MMLDVLLKNSDITNMGHNFTKWRTYSYSIDRKEKKLMEYIISYRCKNCGIYVSFFASKKRGTRININKSYSWELKEDDYVNNLKSCSQIIMEQACL